MEALEYLLPELGQDLANILQLLNPANREKLERIIDYYEAELDELNPIRGLNNGFQT